MTRSTTEAVYALKDATLTRYTEAEKTVEMIAAPRLSPAWPPRRTACRACRFTTRWRSAPPSRSARPALPTPAESVST